MEYSTGELARMAGITTRTLRWYDEKGLLRPCRTDSAGVRYYSSAEVDRLQQIMFYRELDFDLNRIKQCLDDPGKNRLTALKEQLALMETEASRMERIIIALKKNICAEERNETMSDISKFDAFKKELVNENERRYGDEARQKYGDESVDRANKSMLNMSPGEYETWEQLGKDILSALERSVKDASSPASETGRAIAQMHARWLEMSAGQYSPEMHRGIAQMYTMDERFTAYYDRNIPGCAQFLASAVLHWI